MVSFPEVECRSQALQPPFQIRGHRLPAASLPPRQLVTPGSLRIPMGEVGPARSPSRRWVGEPSEPAAAFSRTISRDFSSPSVRMRSSRGPSHPEIDSLFYPPSVRQVSVTISSCADRAAPIHQNGESHNRHIWWVRAPKAIATQIQGLGRGGPLCPIPLPGNPLSNPWVELVGRLRWHRHSCGDIWA
jgi:hypothetical protein